MPTISCESLEYFPDYSWHLSIVGVRFRLMPIIAERFVFVMPFVRIRYKVGFD